MAITAIVISTIPLHITTVQTELIKQNHAYYDNITGNFTLKECK